MAYVIFSENNIFNIFSDGSSFLSGAFTPTGGILFTDGSTINNSNLTGAWNLSGSPILNANSTGNLVDKGQTGAFLTSSTAGGLRTLNVTGVLISGSVGLTGAGNITITSNGQIITFSGVTGNLVDTGMTGLLLVGKNQTGNFIDAGMTGKLTSGFYPRFSNPSGYITGLATGSFVTNSQTGNFLDLGQTGNFIDKGQTGIFIDNGKTGQFINLIENRDVLFNGNFFQNSIGHFRKGLDIDADAYPFVSFNSVNDLTTGAWVLNTSIPRDGNVMFMISIRGHNSFSNSNTGNVDFTVFGYAQQAALGNIDGLSGATSPFHMSIRDNGTLKVNKYIGINSSGKIAVAFGDIDSVLYFQRVYADVVIDWHHNTGLYLTGYNWTLGTGINFGWLDKTQISGLQTHLHDAQQIVAGILPSGRLLDNYPGITGLGTISNISLTGIATLNNSNILVSSQTGSFVDNGMTGGFIDRGQTGKFLVDGYGVKTINVNSVTTSGNLTLTGAGIVSLTLNGNTISISGSSSGINTGGFIDRGMTGNFVDKGASGLLTGQFYPLNSNPSSYIKSSQTGSFIDSGMTGTFSTSNFVTNISGVLDARLQSTGDSLLNLINASSAGVSSINAKSGTLTLTGAGNVSVIINSQQFTISGNTGAYSTFALASNTGLFVTSNQTGNFITISQTGSFIDSGKTGSFLTTSQTGNFNNEFVNLTELSQFFGPGLMMGGVEGDNSYPILGGFVTNALTNWTRRGGTLNTTNIGGITSITIASGTVLPDFKSNTERVFCSINRNNTGTAIFEFTGLPFSTPAHAIWEPFIIARSSSVTAAITGIITEFLDNSGIWTTIFNGTPTWTGNCIWGGPAAVVLNFPLQGVRFTLNIASGVSTINPAEFGVWNKNYIKGTNLYAFQFDDVNFRNISGLSINISGVPVITASQTGNFLTNNQTGILTGQFYPYFSNPNGYALNSDLISKTGPIGPTPTLIYLSSYSAAYQNRGFNSFSTIQDALNFISGSGSGIYKIIIESGNFGTGSLTGVSPANRLSLGEISLFNQFNSIQTPYLNLKFKNIDGRIRIENNCHLDCTWTSGLATFDSATNYPQTIIDSTLALTSITGGINNISASTVFLDGQSNADIYNSSISTLSIGTFSTGLRGLRIFGSSVNAMALLGGTVWDPTIFTILNSNIRKSLILNSPSNGVHISFSGTSTVNPPAFVLQSGWGGLGYSLTGLYLIENTGAGVVTSTQIITSNLTGFFIDNGKTGLLTNQFYPLTSNPSGYILSSQTGTFIDNGMTGAFVPSGKTGIFYTTNNLSGYISTGNGDTRYIKRGTDLSNVSVGLFTDGGIQEFFYDGSNHIFELKTSDRTKLIILESGLISGFNISGDTNNARFNNLWVNNVKITGNGGGSSSSLTGFTGAANSGNGSGIYTSTDNNTIVLKSIKTGIGINITGTSSQLGIDVNLSNYSVSFTGFTGIITSAAYTDLISTGISKGIWLINAQCTFGSNGGGGEFGDVALKVYNGQQNALHTGWAIAQSYANGVPTAVSFGGIANISSNTGSRIALGIFHNSAPQLTVDSTMGIGTSGIGIHGSSGISPTQLTLVRIG